MTLAVDPRPVQPDRRHQQMTTLFLLGPPGSGRSVVGSCLETLNRGRLCRLDITRPLAEGEDRRFRHVSPAEFNARLASGQYILPRMNGDHWMGCHLPEVGDCLQRPGRTTIIAADEVRTLAEARRRLLTVWPECRILTVLLLTQPHNVWIGVLRKRRPPDLANRVRTVRRQLDEAMTAFRHEITHVITNRAGDVRTTVFKIEALLRS